MSEYNNTEAELSLPGFDTVVGLSRVAGNKALYRKLLINFFSNYQDYPDKIELSIKEHNFEEAKHIIHTLKGVAGNLGAIDLQNSCAALEFLIKEETAIIANSVFIEFLDIFKVAMSGANVVLNEKAAKPELLKQSNLNFSETEKQKLVGYVQQSMILLSQSNPEVLVVLEQIQNILGDRFGVEFKEVLTAMEGFDFELAKERLRDFTKKINLY